MSRGKGNAVPEKAKKISIPKEENKELLELRVLQNTMYFMSQCNVQLKDPTVVYQTANALAEIYNFMVPRIKELSEKNNIEIPALKDEKSKKEKK